VKTGQDEYVQNDNLLQEQRVSNRERKVEQQRREEAWRHQRARHAPKAQKSRNHGEGPGQRQFAGGERAQAFFRMMAIRLEVEQIIGEKLLDSTSYPC
jgi:hypothetical protein